MKKILIMISLLFLVSGCSIWSKMAYVWRGDFLKIDADISINRWKLSPEDKVLINAFFKMDLELEDVLTKLQVLNASNFKQVSKGLIGSMPWIKGIYMFNMGNKSPIKDQDLKEAGSPISFKIQRCKQIFKSKQIGTGYFVQKGSNLIIVQREMKGDGTANYKVVALDMKILVASKCNLFQRLAIIGKKNNVILANGLDANILSHISWMNLLKKYSKGVLEVKQGTLFWMVRFVGKDPMFYVVMR